MTLTLTPEPSSSVSDAPRVRVEAVAPDGGTFTSLLLRRDGVDVRRQPFVGASESLAFDYEAPFGRSLSYQLTGFYLPVSAPDWTETWASLASWTGSGFSASSGKAVSSTNGAQIVRSASGTIQRVGVTDPDYVRVELLTAGDVVVASVAVTSSVALVGTSSTSTSGSGSFEVTLADGTVTATAFDSSWSLSRPYTGTPTKVRVVSLARVFGTYLSKFGSSGSGNGQLNGPSGVAVDASGNVFVVDSNQARVQKFNSAGVYVSKFGTAGSGNGQFNQPEGIAIDGSGNIFVVDYNNDRVQKFNSSGVYQSQFGTSGTGNGQFDSPRGIAIDGSGNIFVTDSGNSRVQKFNSSGVYQSQFGTAGSGNGQFNTPMDLAIDGSSNIFVADLGNKRVQKFNSAGTYQSQFGTAGSGNGQFNNPSNITIDGSGNLLVVDAGNNRIQKFNSAGTYQDKFGATGSGNGQFNMPYGIAIDGSGNVVVTDYNNNRVQTFAGVTLPASTDDIATTLVIAELAYSGSATTQLDETRAWLIHPSQPTLSVAIDENVWSDTGVNVSLESAQSTTHEQPTSIFSPPGRTRSVTYPLGPRRVGLWTLVLQMAALEARNAVLAALADGAPLLLRSPQTFDWDLPDDWYAVGDVTQARIVRPLQKHYRTLTLPLTPVDSPPVALAPEFTYGDALLAAPTYNDVLANYDSYLDFLTGTAS